MRRKSRSNYGSEEISKKVEVKLPPLSDSNSNTNVNMPSPQLGVSLLPRTLRISPSRPITRAHILALYKEQLRVAHSYSAYNFKHYFVRRARHQFRVELPALIEAAASAASTSAPSSSIESPKSAAKEEENSIYAPITSTPTSSPSTSVSTLTSSEQVLRTWYDEALKELGVLARGSIVNRLYEAPKLVVEGRGRVMIVGGGGAGAEAA